jgi:hypothetical protein
MKLSLPLKLTAISTAVLATIITLSPLKAAVIGEQPINQSEIVAVAAPFGSNKYSLVIVEQIPGQKQCWSEMGSQPTVVEPLWTTFDFTGHCRRATDANGYSVHLDGQDTSQDYLLDVVEKDGELQLVAMNFKDRSRTVVGKTFGLNQGKFLRIFLNPGWQFTKKTVDGKVVGHVYFSGDTAAIAAAGNTPPTPPPAAPSFSDTATDIYKDEIEQAVALGFIAGFQDKTFRPQDPLTREQLVSMVIGALGTIADLKIQLPAQAVTQPYPDVATSRWSATKIQWAKDNQIVTGYPDGTFRPEKPVTRAELMAVLKRAAEFVRVERGLSPELTVKPAATSFSDISTHWGKNLIEQMSGYCQVASPYNETGNAFNPDQASGRNYAAAATLRMHNCAADAANQASQ